MSNWNPPYISTYEKKLKKIVEKSKIKILNLEVEKVRLEKAEKALAEYYAEQNKER